MVKRLPIIEVEWTDSCSVGGWKSRADYEKYEPDECRSIGYLVKRTHSHIILVQTQSDQNSNVTDGITIPRSAIKSVRKL